MTTEDVLKFCEKGSHEYIEDDVLISMKKSHVERIFILYKCTKCPSRWVKDI